jgi:hypothetical protein
LKYEYHEGGIYLFKEGDRSNDRFYAIISGSVCVVKKHDSNVFQRKDEEEDPKNDPGPWFEILL